MRVRHFPMQIRFDEHVGVLVANGKNFTLKRAHWHTPSEHRIHGKQYVYMFSLSLSKTILTFDNYRFPAELHLVHQAVDGNFSVVSVLYKYGAPDTFLTKVDFFSFSFFILFSKERNWKS